MADIEEYLTSCQHTTKQAEKAEINDLCGILKRLLQQLDIVFATLRMPHGTPTDEDFTNLDEAIKEAAKLWKESNLNYTPNFHLLHRHALPLMREYNGFGEMLGDDLEKSHQDMDRIHRQIVGLSLCKKRAHTISRKMKVKRNGDVQKEVDGVMSRSKRKRTGTGTTPKEEKQIVSKTARTAKLKEDWAEEKASLMGQLWMTMQDQGKSLETGNHNNIGDFDIIRERVFCDL